MQLLLACPYFFQWWSHILFGDTFSSENLVFCQNDIQWLKISEISDSCQEENLHFDQIQGYTCTWKCCDDKNKRWVGELIGNKCDS